MSELFSEFKKELGYGMVSENKDGTVVFRVSGADALDLAGKLSPHSIFKKKSMEAALKWSDLRKSYPDHTKKIDDTFAEMLQSDNEFSDIYDGNIP